MKQKLVLGILSFLLSATIGFAQGDDVPQAVKQTFTQQYPHAENVEYKDNLLHVWVNFTQDGEKMKANYKKDGQWENTEKDWQFDKLPDVVKDGFRKSKYANRTVEETKIIYRAGGTQWYRIKTKKNDLQKKYLYFNDQGQLLEDNITI
ncbi:MAG: PepSY-like domain-containing protein [Flavisolibacter sp.]